MFLEKINNSNLKAKLIKYGDYSREEYFDLVKKSKTCAWFSIEDYCSNAQLECQLLNCPIIGTPYNLTDTFDKKYWIEGQTLDERWIRWKSNLPDLFMEGIEKVLIDIKEIGNKPSEYIKKNYSHKSYSEFILRILKND